MPYVKNFTCLLQRKDLMLFVLLGSQVATGKLDLNNSIFLWINNIYINMCIFGYITFLLLLHIKFDGILYYLNLNWQKVLLAKVLQRKKFSLSN